MRKIVKEHLAFGFLSFRLIIYLAGFITAAAASVACCYCYCSIILLVFATQIYRGLLFTHVGKSTTQNDHYAEF